VHASGLRSIRISAVLCEMVLIDSRLGMPTHRGGSEVLCVKRVHRETTWLVISRQVLEPPGMPRVQLRGFIGETNVPPSPISVVSLSTNASTINLIWWKPYTYPCL
jgi:hypothetical protein